MCLEEKKMTDNFIAKVKKTKNDIMFGENRVPIDDVNLFYLIQYGYFVEMIEKLLERKKDIGSLKPIVEYSNSKLNNIIIEKIREEFLENHRYKPGKYEKTVAKLYFKDYPDVNAWIEIIE